MMKGMKDLKNAKMHLEEHVKYPASKKQLVEACNMMEDFSMEDKKWFEQNLPDGTYKSSDEVMQALHMDKSSSMYA